MLALALRVLWLLAVASALFKGVTYLLWYYEKRVHGPAEPRQPVLPRVTSWVGEWLAFMLVVSMWPFGLLGHSPFPTKRRDAPRPDARPVVLIPGWSMNRGAMVVLAERLRRDGREAYAINYPSASHDTDRMAASIAASIEDVAARTGAERIDVIAHSQGGVLVRAAAREHDVLERLGNVVTLGSPHRGTAPAAMVRWRSLRHLWPQSRFLERLLEDDPVPVATNFTAIYSNFDASVFPAELGYYPGAFNVILDDVGHEGMLLSERVYKLAAENLAVEPPALAREQRVAL